MWMASLRLDVCRQTHALSLRMIVSALAPSEIVVGGEVETAWYLFGPAAQPQMTRNWAPAHACSRGRLLRV